MTAAPAQMCAQTQGPSRGQTQTAVAVIASTKTTYASAHSAPWLSDVLGISKCGAVREASRESVVECCMAVVRTTRLACHREFRRSGSRKNLNASLRRESRIESPRAALSPSAFVRMLPFNQKRRNHVCFASD
jgi:hypothetical protein